MNQRILQHYLLLLAASLVVFPSAHLATADEVKDQTPVVVQTVPIRSSGWRAVQEIAKDTVVQIFVYTAHMDWFERYRSPKQSAACGSGFFIDVQGHIVSNYHVVHEATSIKSQIPSFGRERFDVEIVGVSPERDVSLLKLTDASIDKIKKKLGSIPFLELGDSDTVVRTQEVLSLGYPLGQEKLKSTHGIVSGRERIGRESYLQMTAPLNPGISGGPCLAMDGTVIGINTAGIQVAQNIGYVIPISDVKSVIQHLYDEKFLPRPSLGIKITFTSAEMLELLGNPEPGGVYISKVYPATLAEKIGLQDGDMLYELNGHPVDWYGEIIVDWNEDPVSLIDLINRFEIEQDLHLVVYRKGERKEITGKLTLEEPWKIKKIYPKFESVTYEIIGGMIVMPLTLDHVVRLVKSNPSYVRYMERENQYESKLLITHVFPNSATHQARSVSVGDIITHVNGQEVKTLDDFRKAVRDGAAKDYLSILTDDKNFLVLSHRQIVEEEEYLASLFFFKPSALIQELSVYHKVAPALPPLFP